MIKSSTNKKRTDWTACFTSYTPGDMGVRNQGLRAQFLYMIAEVFSHKISSGEKSYSHGPGGGLQSTFFQSLLGNTLIADCT